MLFNSLSSSLKCGAHIASHSASPKLFWLKHVCTLHTLLYLVLWLESSCIVNWKYSSYCRFVALFLHNLCKRACVFPIFILNYPLCAKCHYDFNISIESSLPIPFLLLICHLAPYRRSGEQMEECNASNP